MLQHLLHACLACCVRGLRFSCGGSAAKKKGMFSGLKKTLRLRKSSKQGNGQLPEAAESESGSISGTIPGGWSPLVIRFVAHSACIEFVASILSYVYNFVSSRGSAW